MRKNDYYEFVEGSEKEIEPGVIVRRIRATKDIPELGVFAGDVGGFIQDKSNLFGYAWVFNEACVYGNSWVAGGSRVAGNAQISGNYWFFGNSIVGG